jgi:hypothetical protein
MPAKRGSRAAGAETPDLEEPEPSPGSVTAALGGLSVAAGSRQVSGSSTSSKKSKTSSKISSRSTSSGKFFGLFNSSHSVFDI